MSHFFLEQSIAFSNLHISNTMAGSQLKQLKEALKAKGLVGQTNIKRKNKKATAPSETRRDNEESKLALNKIRDEFNQFDTRINRTKHDYTVILGGKFVKAGSKQHNEASKTNSSIEKAMRMDYDAERKVKNKAGGLVDRRFGEKNQHLTSEEKMLERFTRERQSASKKNVFSLGSDDEFDEDEGFSLTHSGKQLTFEEGLGDAEQKYVDEDSIEPPRKKSKKEVMAEVMAKSKFHKKQRQMAFQKAQEDIEDLDEDFDDVLNDLHSQKQPKQAMVAKSQEDIEYDSKVRELTYDRRSVPADRTKTAEEIEAEHAEKMKKLETDRLNRMSGLTADSGEGDDLDEFWAGSDEEAEGSNAEDDDDEGSDVESGEEDTPRRKAPTVLMPENHEQFLESLLGGAKPLVFIKKIVDTYHPRLAQGNKDKMDAFVGIIFEHILYLSNGETDALLVDDLTKLLRSMAEKYNQALVETIRAQILDIESRVANKCIEKKDLVFFVVLGYVFSASDHYHLVITPTLILLNRLLTVAISDTNIQTLGQGLFACDVLLSYQFFAKRYDPEVIKFLEKCIILLVPEPTKLGDTLSHKASKTSLNLSKTFKPTSKPQAVQILSLFETPKNEEEYKFQLLARALAVMDKCVNTWKEKSALIEVLESFESILKHTSRYYSVQLPQLSDMLARYGKLKTNMGKSRKPLTLQVHRQMAIQTYAPKFEENFNPDKKSYDENRERQEVNKMKSQIKKEKKSTMKDIRRSTKFTARQQIGEKKQMYSEYHKKMANIVSSISTVEGAEKNLYEREKKRRQNQR